VKTHEGAFRAFRLLTLLVPTWGAWYVVFAAKDGHAVVRAVALALGPLWALLVLALVVRAAAAALDPERPRGAALVEIDVLTPAGVALAWTSASFIAGAAWVGYASLAVVGLLGTTVLHLVVTYALFAMRSADPIGTRTVARRFSPDVAAEGDDVVEELRLDGTRIPLGFRLFVEGRIGGRWPTT
jgi:hypothetical protein